MTPHNSAKPGDFAKTVLMPGDPLRSRYIAENYLTDPVLVNNVRGVQGYTGKWKDVPVSVMASGMGMPSIGIYSWELYDTYGVENIIRVGSAGALQDNVNVMDIVIAQAASTNTNYIQQFGFPGSFAPIGDATLIQHAVSAAIAEPELVPATYCGLSPSSYNARTAPICAMPCRPPPEKTTPSSFFRFSLSISFIHTSICKTGRRCNTIPSPQNSHTS